MPKFEARQIDGDAIVAAMTDEEKAAMLKRWSVDATEKDRADFLGMFGVSADQVTGDSRPYTHIFRPDFT